MLKNDTVFISGATSGFGAACARLIARQGAKLILTGRRQDRLDALQQEFGADCHTLRLDMRDRAAVAAVTASLPPAFRNVSVLINNAGLSLGLVPAHQAALDDWTEMVDTNVTGLMTLTHALLPGMVERNRGHVVNIGSVAASYPYPGGNVYGATKAFVRQFSLNLRADLLGTAVRVSVIEPGMAETEFSTVRFKGDTDRAGAVYRGVTPLSADDVAETVLWCLTRPAHVNINAIELMPVAQTFSAFTVHREKP